VPKGAQIVQGGDEKIPEGAAAPLIPSSMVASSETNPFIPTRNILHILVFDTRNGVSLPFVNARI